MQIWDLREGNVRVWYRICADEVLYVTITEDGVRATSWEAWVLDAGGDSARLLHPNDVLVTC